MFWETWYQRLNALKIRAVLSVLEHWQKYQHYKCCNNECNVSCPIVTWWAIRWQMNTMLETAGALDGVAWHWVEFSAVTSFGLSTTNPCFSSSVVASSHFSSRRWCMRYIRQWLVIVFNDTVPDVFAIGPSTLDPERWIVRVRTEIRGRDIMRRRERR
jgi:hypothetical protein